MASWFSRSGRAKTIHRLADSGGAAERLTCPLAFSAAGLFANCLALAMQGDPTLDSLRACLILGAAPLAALVSLRIYR